MTTHTKYTDATDAAARAGMPAATAPQEVSAVMVDPGAAMRRPLFPAIRWGAVLAGVAVGISVQLALTLLGIASGLSNSQVTEGETIGSGPLLWAGFSMLVSAFVGGYVAARMSGLKRKADGVLHGAVSWAVTTILFAVLATSVGGAMMSTVFSTMTQTAGAAAASGANSPIGAMLQGQIGKMDPAELKRFQAAIQAGQRDAAIQQLVNSLKVDPNRAATIVDQALILSGSPTAASPQSRAATERTLRGAGTAAWVVFLAVALALAVGVMGGAMGVAGSRRVDWRTTGTAAPAHV